MTVDSILPVSGSCVVCALPLARKALLEKHLQDGTSSVETLGQQYRIDYDAIREHMRDHIRKAKTALETLEDLHETYNNMLSTAEDLVDSEESADNIKAFASFAATYQKMVLELSAENRRIAKDKLKADVLYEAIILRVLNPVVMDVSKVVIKELTTLLTQVKAEVGSNPVVANQFQEATKRIGVLISETVPQHTETLRVVVEGKEPKKK